MIPLLPSLRVLLALSVWIASSTQLAAADDSRPAPIRHAFDLPADTAERSLKRLAAETGLEVLFATEMTAGVRARPVRGELTALEAANRLLNDTGLVAVQDAKTGTITINRAPTDESKNDASRRADEPAARVDRGMVVLDDYSVNATKVDGLINRGLLQGGENAPLYHDVVSRADIERLGVSSMEELFRYLPQTSSTSTPLQASAGNNRFSGGLGPKVSTVGLRGFSSAQTVVLVNGRALPRSGLLSNGGADISRIPIAAIERVEILPYAGSAIYGAGALGGAINIILRKEFSGRDLTTYIGTSSEGGATEYRMTYLEGRAFNQGRTNLTFTLSYHHRDALLASERGYLDEALRRYGPNSTARNAQGVLLFEQLILPAFAGAPGTVLIGNAPNAAINDLGIPGAPGVRFAAIPAGTTAAESFALTPSSFAATAGQAELAPRLGRTILYEPVDSYSFNAQVEHDIVPGKLSAYGEFTFGYNRKEFSMPQVLSVSLSETDPLNPFRTGVTPGFVGRPIRVYLDTPDIADPSVLYEYGAARAVVGLKGTISETWEWSADGAIDYTHNTVRSNNPPDAMMNLQGLTPFSSPGPAAPAAVRRAVYPLFADHSQFPMSAADSAHYFNSVRYSSTLGLQKEGNARLMGQVFPLPAGPLRASLVAKYQNWEFDGGQKFYGSDAWSQLVNNAPVDMNESGTTADREIWQGAVEFSLPIISAQWRPIPVEAFDLQGSFSRERDITGGIDQNDEPFTNKQAANSSVIAGKLQITPDIALRGSYSEGFYPPEWSDVSLPTSSFSLPGFFPDPRRGNTMQFTPNMSIMQGGNPNLRPETAESFNYGVIFTPRFARDLSLSVDFWKIEKVDAIVSTSFVDIIANPAAFGFLITREAPSPADVELGWEGRITAVDARAFNASITRTEGADVRLRYAYETDSIGRFAFNGSASFTNHFLLLATPTAPIINTAGGSGPVRWRGNGSLTWMNDAWSATVTGRYVGYRSTTTTAPSPSFPGAFPLDGGRLSDFVRWDVQASYEIPYRVGGDGWRSWLYGTKWTLGVLNVLNEEPQFVSDGSAFYNSADDPRQRFVYLQVKKSL